MTIRDSIRSFGSSAAPVATARAPRSASRRVWRAPLAAKLAAALIGLVILVLLVNGAINTWLNYDQAKRAALEVQEEKARSAAARVGEFLAEIETQLGWTTGAEWRRTQPDQQRYDFVRLLRQAPAITELSYLDGQGKEKLKVSRLEPDSIGSDRDFSKDPRFVQAVADKIWFGPVEFRRGSEPYMTIALAHVGREPGVTVADVNLKLIWDVVSAIRVGEKGYAYVVDDKGRLIAHPDLSLVLRDTDFSHLPQVKQALDSQAPAEPRAPAMAAPRVGMAEIATAFDGGSVLTAYAVAPRTNWIVFVQQPVSEALASVYRSLLQTLALLGLGLLLALIVGGLLARRMVVPIRRLQQGAEKLGAGDLSQRLDIRTGDEIETLADRFNQMAESIKESYETLEAKVESRTADLNEALQQQTATADVLKVISRSAFDLQAVFDTLISSGVRLIGGQSGTVCLRDGDVYRYRAHFGLPPVLAEWLADHPATLGRATAAGRVLLSGKVECIVDVLDDKDYVVPAHDLNRIRSMLAAPLLRDNRIEGVLVINRAETGSFTQRQIDLVQTFADQAVIAIENVRLFDEVQARTRDLSEALQQQTATADVLKVISRSVLDLDSVLQTLIDTAVRLARGSRGSIWIREGDVLVPRAYHRNVPDELRQYLSATPWPIDGDSHQVVAVREARVVHVPDLSKVDDATTQEVKKRAAYGAGLWVPLIGEGQTIGVFGVPRDEAVAFTDREIEIVKTFADQAVIAIQNSRLFEQVRAKTRDLEESLTQQTATADVLKAISRTAFDLDTVLDTLISTAARLCDANHGQIFRRHGDVYRYAASRMDVDPTYRQYEQSVEITPGRGTLVGRVALEHRAVSVVDAWSDPEYAEKDQAKVGNVRAMLGVPLMRGGEPIGAFALARSAPIPFTERQIELVTTFADQAVIAIENVRLFDEVQAKTRDLSEALHQQTATADVLKVISRSAFDLQAVFDTLVSTAADLNDAYSGAICVRDGDVFRYRASRAHGAEDEVYRYLQDHPATPDRSTVVGRTILSGQVEQIPDILEDTDYAVPMASLGNPARALLGVPLLGKERVEGAIVLTRREPGLYPQRQIETLKTFADQAVIAIENARLFDQVQARTKELAQTVDDLRSAQDRLIQSEKLASLGQLTAGIAHEIKNPLNFVNNFAALSRELIEELKEVVATTKPDEKTKEEIDEITGMLEGNLAKVVQHGKRADSIVKNMLLHSRESSGDHRLVDLNAVVEESVNLAYHGARAEKPGFNVTLLRDFDPSVGEVDLYPQEFTRVLLNLISNGFYATTKRKAEGGEAAFEPTLKASTKNFGDRIEIKIRDNGTGIPAEVKAKMFNPFFTTKPAGEGTGLGLSLSYDIIAKQHGGTIGVDTKPGEFTEFTILIPRGGPPSPKS